MTQYTKDYKFNVTCLQAGQQRRYGDSYYEYEVETGEGEAMAKMFCTNVLCPCRQAYKDWSKDSAGSYFAGYYTFEKTGENKYHYKVTKPFCD